MSNFLFNPHNFYSAKIYSGAYKRYFIPIAKREPAIDQVSSISRMTVCIFYRVGERLMASLVQYIVKFSTIFHFKKLFFSFLTILFCLHRLFSKYCKPCISVHIKFAYICYIKLYILIN